MTVNQWVRNVARELLHCHAVRKVLERIPIVRKVYRGWNRTHPYDVQNGTDTSGFVHVTRLHPAQEMQSLISPYGPSQPSIARRALSALGSVEDYAFIDLGCGKGRCVLVASEFPFREVIGVELSAKLAVKARANAAIVERLCPSRKAARIVEGNVLDFPFPSGKLVFYNFHAFGAEIISKMVERFEAALAEDTPHIFFVYYNAVHFAQLDASPAFRRFFAKQLLCDSTEVGYGGGGSNPVVIWQSVRGSIPTPHECAERSIHSDGHSKARIDE
jgi:SAM-dependent methyltransferase